MKNKWLTAGDVLKTLLRSRGLEEGVRRHSALLGWEEVVGRRIAGRARPLEMRGKTLFVEVDGSAWIQELSFLREEILVKLNRRAGGDGDALDRIVFLAMGEGERGGETGTGRTKDDGRNR
ncbi:MAG: DUF721 domain-containing protein [Candidatus Eisenbacteria bacterium]|nr:DUF721 domain-containing protein [Candidatus Eisenbacteria bacterium]